MAGVLSRIGFSKKPKSKVYDLNTTIPKFSGRTLFNPDLDLEPPAISNLHNRSPKPNCSGDTGREAKRREHKTDIHGGFESQSVHDLEKHAVSKAEQTTKKINGCLKVAEGMSEDASRLLLNLHQQSEQITQTHQAAATIDLFLQRGEKLLGSLGGLFSKRWKPKKSCEIEGHVLTTGKGNYTDQKQKIEKTPLKPQTIPHRSEPLSAVERIEREKAKQDDALSDLSNLLVKLKAMAADMGSEIDRQNKAIDHMQDDVDELSIRIQGANHRARHLLLR